MSARPRRLVVTVASLGFVALGVACVDLFHSTDFDTLCSKSPDDPACAVAEGGAAEVGAPDVGTDTAPSRFDFCTWSSTEARTQAARACAWLGACERPVGESLFGACAVHAQLALDCTANPSLRPRGAVDAFWQCLTSVHSCADVDRCVFPAGVQECVAVTGGTSTACGSDANGSVRLECSGPAGRAHGVEPCALTGQTCSRPNDNSIAKCAGALGFACDAPDAGTCSSTSAVDCRAFGVLRLDQGHDCSLYGAGQCILGSAGPSCAPTKTANTCVGDTRPSCDGTVVRTCIGGQDVRIDCNALGLPCDAKGVSTADPAAACTNPGPPSCTGDDKCSTSTLLESCGRGATYKVDCAAEGLGKCVIDSAGRGACSPPGQ